MQKGESSMVDARPRCHLGLFNSQAGPDSIANADEIPRIYLIGRQISDHLRT